MSAWKPWYLLPLFAQHRHPVPARVSRQIRQSHPPGAGWWLWVAGIDSFGAPRRRVALKTLPGRVTNARRRLTSSARHSFRSPHPHPGRLGPGLSLQGKKRKGFVTQTETNVHGDALLHGRDMGKTQDHRNSVEQFLAVGGGWRLVVLGGLSLRAVLGTKKTGVLKDSPGCVCPVRSSHQLPLGLCWCLPYFHKLDHQWCDGLSKYRFKEMDATGGRARMFH